MIHILYVFVNYEVRVLFVLYVWFKLMSNEIIVIVINLFMNIEHEISYVIIDIILVKYDIVREPTAVYCIFYKTEALIMVW